jgi:hypothetical protein
MDKWIVYEPSDGYIETHDTEKDALKDAGDYIDHLGERDSGFPDCDCQVMVAKVTHFPVKIVDRPATPEEKEDYGWGRILAFDLRPVAAQGGEGGEKDDD